MKLLSSAKPGLAALASIILASHAEAAVNVEFVTVGNPGNAADTTGHGAVAYEYKIAKNETTIGQYCEFLNAKAKSDPYALYSTNMATSTYIAGISRTGSSGSFEYSVIGGTANKPITFVSWFDAARFCNWLHNGQGSGSTETGAYTLNGAISGIYLKNPTAKVWIPSEDEWYKAAYYDATKDGTGGYWLYPTQSDSLGGNTIGNANSANYYDGDFAGNSGMVLTDVGAYGSNSDSFFGTNDQGGNVWEWNDSVSFGSRGLRGDSWGYGDGLGSYLASSRSYGNGPSLQDHGLGFRVASVPEPSAIVLTMLASGVLGIRRKR
ncbi:MAG: SUMF1/EgtB/PvdO family nonheme iron enzyme [Verrucomicrobia bacterium]|nr:SUMF1/EgtB/PvdO family nonheme iron enzyme [Verrucomicrobiota bacterium]